MFLSECHLNSNILRYSSDFLLVPHGGMREREKEGMIFETCDVFENVSMILSMIISTKNFGSTMC